MEYLKQKQKKTHFFPSIVSILLLKLLWPNAGQIVSIEFINVCIFFLCLANNESWKTIFRQLQPQQQK